MNECKDAYLQQDEGPSVMEQFKVQYNVHYVLKCGRKKSMGNLQYMLIDLATQGND